MDDIQHCKRLYDHIIRGRCCCATEQATGARKTGRPRRFSGPHTAAVDGGGARHTHTHRAVVRKIPRGRLAARRRNSGITNPRGAEPGEKNTQQQVAPLPQRRTHEHVERRSLFSHSNTDTRAFLTATVLISDFSHSGRGEEGGVLISQTPCSSTDTRTQTQTQTHD